MYYPFTNSPKAFMISYSVNDSGFSSVISKMQLGKVSLPFKIRDSIIFTAHGLANPNKVSILLSILENLKYDKIMVTKY